MGSKPPTRTNTLARDLGAAFPAQFQV